MNGFEALCRAIKSLFMSGFGDSVDSGGGDFAVPASLEWIQLFSIATPAVLLLRTLDIPTGVESKEIFITFNNKAPGTGFRMPADSILTFDDVIGTLYVRPVDPTETVNINYLIASKKVNE